MTRRAKDGIRSGLFCIAFLAGCVFCLASGTLAAEDAPGQPPSGQAAVRDDGAGAATDLKQLAELIQQQKSLISREMGQVKREIAALGPARLVP